MAITLYRILTVDLCKKIDTSMYPNIYFHDILYQFLVPKIDISESCKIQPDVLGFPATTISTPVDVAVWLGTLNYRLAFLVE